jgi:hypothetical protein
VGEMEEPKQNSEPEVLSLQDFGIQLGTLSRTDPFENLNPPGSYRVHGYVRNCSGFVDIDEYEEWTEFRDDFRDVGDYREYTIHTSACGSEGAPQVNQPDEIAGYSMVLSFWSPTTEGARPAQRGIFIDTQDRLVAEALHLAAVGLLKQTHPQEELIPELLKIARDTLKVSVHEVGIEGWVY